MRTISYEFDDAGQLLLASDPDSAFAYAYDVTVHQHHPRPPTGPAASSERLAERRDAAA